MRSMESFIEIKNGDHSCDRHFHLSKNQCKNISAVCATLWTLPPVPLLRHIIYTLTHSTDIFYPLTSAQNHPEASSGVCCKRSRGRVMIWPQVQIKENQHFDCGKKYPMSKIHTQSHTTHGQQQLVHQSVSSHSGIPLVHFQVLFLVRETKSELRSVCQASLHGSIL